MQGFSECRPFLVHLRAEHARLHAEVCEVERALAMRSEPVAPLMILESGPRKGIAKRRYIVSSAKAARADRANTLRWLSRS